MPGFTAYHGVDAVTHQRRVDELAPAGFRPVALNVSGDPGDARYAAPPWASSHPLRLTHGHRGSTSPGTGSADTRSLAGSHTSTTSLPDSQHCNKKTQVITTIDYSSPTGWNADRRGPQRVRCASVRTSSDVRKQRSGHAGRPVCLHRKTEGRPLVTLRDEGKIVIQPDDSAQAANLVCAL